MMTDRELMQQALSALVTAELDGNCEYGVTDSLRARLAQPEPEPVAWMDAPRLIYLQVCEESDCDHSFDAHDDVSWSQDKINDSDIPYIRADTAPPQREWMEQERAVGYREGHQAALKQRVWQGLTDEEYEAMAEQYVTNCYFDTLKYAKAIEAKLKGKNA